MQGWYKNSKCVHLWLHLLLNVNHEAKEFLWNFKTIRVEAGQFITGRKQLSVETGIAESTIEKILKLFEKEAQIEQQKTTKFRLISIKNWKDYQEKEQQATQQEDNKGTTRGQQRNTNKNDKNYKNEKNVTNVTEQSSEHGRPDINECYQFLKDQLGATPDGSTGKNRQYCKLLLDRLKKDYPDKSPTEQVKALITFGRKDSFHGRNITNFEYLYRSAQKIIESVKTRKVGVTII